jgi:hypothetical protein
MSTRDRKLFLLFAGVAFAYVALRAVLVPLTHDEARTFFVYTRTGEFLPWLGHWDAGNHVLCTALGWLSFEAFGMAAWSLRLASVLAFVLYIAYAYRWGLLLGDRAVRWCLWPALLFTPVLIEFFALYRGYGMAMAFLLMALYHTVALVRKNSGTHALAALAAWALAVASMLSLMVLWCAALLLIAVVLMRRPVGSAKRAARAGAWLLLGALPLAGAALYSSELKVRGLLYYGTDQGLYQGTARSLAEALFNAPGDLATALLVLIPMLLLLVGAWSLLRVGRPALSGAFAVLLFFLLAEVVGRLVLGALFDLPGPLDRTALHWLPLFVLAAAFSVDALRDQRFAFRWAAVVLLVLPFRTFTTANLDHTAIWPEEAISGNIFDRAARMQKAAGRPLLIDAYRQMPPQWDHERLLHYPDLAPLSPHGFPQPDCDLLLIDTTFFTAPPGFRTIAVSASGRQVLKERTAPLRMALLKDSMLDPSGIGGEFHPLFEPDITALQAQELVLELELVFRSEERCPETQLVIEVDGPAGEHLHYDLMELKTLQRSFTGDTLHLLRRIPSLSGNTTRLACYLWNQRRQNLSLSYGRIRLLRIQPDHDLRTP